MVQRTVTEIDLQQAQDAMMEKVQADLSGPRALKEPGTPDWCWQTIGHLQMMWNFFEGSSERYLTTLTEAEKYRVWEVVPVDEPFGSKEKMIEVLEIGDENEAKQRLQQRALKTVALRHHGANQHREGGSGQVRMQRGRGIMDYLIARIARDRPDVLERIKQGEFKTAAEAARAAGIIRKKTKRVSLGDNIDRLASALQGHYTPEQFTELSRRMLQLRRQRRPE